MCGIVGYTGKKQAQEIVIDSLKKLEYRGYDSAGLATISKNEISEKKCSGRVEELENENRHLYKILYALDERINILTDDKH